VARLDTTAVPARIQLGEIAAEAGDRDVALRHFRRVVALDPKNHAALRQIARIYVDAGDPSAAMVALIDVLGVQPDDVWALFNLGMAYYETGQYDRAVAQFRRVVERSPGDPRTWFVLGEALVREGRSTPEAITAYERGLAIDSRFADEHVTLGDLYIRVGNEAGALREFQAAAALSPELAASLQPRIDDLRRRMR
jgi:tetratricopeptide (TPR) repeat protein